LNELLETDIDCPYCGEQISVVIEVLEESQEYIEDCQVCCRPIVFSVMLTSDDQTLVSVRSEND
jgi:transcription elongation factor Elf1